MREQSKEMTVLQRRVYDFIRTRMETEFCPPTRVEIARRRIADFHSRSPEGSAWWCNFYRPPASAWVPAASDRARSPFSALPPVAGQT